ncbi:hypothetical protein PIB30_012890 [Stylosanthes scabra]|uniref:Plant bHLH transcription factor ACT-like domain-containing protein n=1 Tax=Stylosanthes scabra TaxID=79078 RepID=A0ABU6X3J9_9FABA|nr:hypothetical protein [Stylosanthes scabra]
MKRDERRMVSRVHHKRTGFHHRNLQHLHSITKSHALYKTSPSVILDASVEYIRSLKKKLQELKQLAVSSSSTQNFINYGPMPMLKVEEQEEGFMIRVLSQRNCKGLLVFILEAFEELGLQVLQARVSCADAFSLEALAIKEHNEGDGHMDAQVVVKVMSKAIKNWREVPKQ